MKVVMKISVLFVVFCCMMSPSGFAQQVPYRTAAGLAIDAGNGSSWVGPSIKHFYRNNHAVTGSLMFATNYVVLGAEYSHNKPFSEVEGLYWNVGVGPQIGLGRNSAHIYVRPSAGLEFKIPETPLVAGLDWRPSWLLTGNSWFEPGRFGITFKYIFD